MQISDPVQCDISNVKLHSSRVSLQCMDHKINAKRNSKECILKTCTCFCGMYMFLHRGQIILRLAAIADMALFSNGTATVGNNSQSPLLLLLYLHYFVVEF